MDSFIFNSFKEQLLTGNIKRSDTWWFHLVNKKLAEDFGDGLKNVPNIDTLEHLATRNELEKENLSYSEYVGPGAGQRPSFLASRYYTNWAPVYYKYKISSTTSSSDAPNFADTDNWKDFIAKYPGNEHLFKMFLTERPEDEPEDSIVGKFCRMVPTGELDAYGNEIMRPRGFYFVETMEELRWCADKVNGIINGRKTKVFNNNINIVFGDNIGVATNVYLTDLKELNFRIGSDIDRQFEGIIFGNGYRFQNVKLTCSGNQNGLVGYLGKNGIIDTIEITGNNLIVCDKKINIDHLKQDCCDINAGLLCGKNYGTISNIVVGESCVADTRGWQPFTNAGVVTTLTIADFAPAVYTVSNKTDSGTAFSHPTKNLYFPSYLCINSMGNIIPYVGYFAEGVFATYAIPPAEDTTYLEDEGKGFWKSDYMYCGTDSSGDVGFYPYDNSHVGEWTFPGRVTFEGENKNYTGQALFYDIKLMLETKKINFGSKAAGDWATDMCLIPVSHRPYKINSDGTISYDEESGNEGLEFDWQLNECAYMDKSIKMHQFNRVSYNIGVLIGSNYGDISNIAIYSEDIILNSTFVGFIGGVVGKQAANYRKMENVSVNLCLNDTGARNHYISDTGKNTQIDTPQFYITTMSLLGKDEDLNSVVKFYDNVDVMHNNYDVDPKYLINTHPSGTRDERRLLDTGRFPTIQLRLESPNYATGENKKTIKHIGRFDLSYLTGEETGGIIDKVIKSYFTASEIKDVLHNYGVPVSVDPKKDYTLASAPKCSGKMFLYGTGANAATSDKGTEGVLYRFGRLGLDSGYAADNDFKDMSDPTCSNRIHIMSFTDFESANDDEDFKDENGSVWLLKNVRFKVYTAKAWSGIIDVYGNPSISFDCVDGDENKLDGKYFYLTSVNVGKLFIKFRTNQTNGLQTVPSSEYGDIAPTLDSGRIIQYNMWDIVGAKDLTYTLVYTETVTEEGEEVQYTDLWEMKQEILRNPENIGHTVTYNIGDNEYLCNDEADYSYATNTLTIAGKLLEKLFDSANSYDIELKSIKNVGAICGSLVVTDHQEYNRVHGWLETAEYIAFKRSANCDCYEKGNQLIYLMTKDEEREWNAQDEAWKKRYDWEAFDITDFEDGGRWFIEEEEPEDDEEEGETIHRCKDTKDSILWCYTKPHIVHEGEEYEGYEPGDQILKVKCGSWYDDDDDHYMYGNSDGFEITAGVMLGIYKGTIMFAFPPLSFPVNIHDYTFANRYGGFAAVCELNSAMIHEPWDKDKRFITMKDCAFSYRENDPTHNPVGAKFGHVDAGRYDNVGLFTKYSPIECNIKSMQKDGSFTYPYGVGLPFIGEIKPTYIAIPSINECAGSNSNWMIDVTTPWLGHTQEEKESELADGKLSYYNRSGLCTIDQSIAAPNCGKEYWTINTDVDLPGLWGYNIAQDEAVGDHIYFKRDNSKLINYIFKFENGIHLNRGHSGKSLPVDVSVTGLMYKYTSQGSDIEQDDGTTYKPGAVPPKGVIFRYSNSSEYDYIDPDTGDSGEAIEIDRRYNLWHLVSTGYGESDKLFVPISKNYDIGPECWCDNTTDRYNNTKMMTPYPYFGSSLKLTETKFKGYTGLDVIDPNGGRSIVYPGVRSGFSSGGYYNNFRPCFFETEVDEEGYPIVRVKYISDRYIPTNTYQCDTFVRDTGKYHAIFEKNRKKALSYEMALIYNASGEGVEKFKYNYTKVVPEKRTQDVMGYHVNLGELYVDNEPRFGFWITQEESLLDQNIQTYSLAEHPIYDTFKFENDKFTYAPNILHFGYVLNEDTIIQILKTTGSFVVPGIITDDFDGILVNDSKGNLIMYINTGLGTCGDGKLTWNMILPLGKGKNNDTGSGLILEVK